MKVKVISESTNSFPIVNAGPNITIKSPTNSVTLNGNASDVDGEISLYSWSKISGASATLNNQNTASLTILGLAAGAYTFRLSATDNEGAVAFDDIFVFVLAESTNESPVANAGTDRLAVLPLNSITINGSATDNDGEIMTYEWSQSSGAPLTLTNSALPNLTVSDLGIGQYTFKLRVLDDGDAEDSDEMILTVSDVDVNQPPVASAGPDRSLVLPTNSIVLNGSAFDPEGNVASYLWNKVSGGNAVLTNSANAQLTVSGLELGVYSFRLRIKDEQGLSATDNMTLNVLPENTNQNPVVNAGPDKNIKFPQDQSTINATVSDSDGAITSISWSKLSGGNVVLGNETSLDLALSELEIDQYVFEITATDDNDATATDAMMLSVLPENANSPPTVNAGTDIQLSLPENSVNITASASDPDEDELTYLWSKVSGSTLTLTNTDQSTVSISDLVEGSYKLRIRVIDLEGATAEDFVNVQVLSEDLPKPPIVNTGSNFSIELPRDELVITGEAVSEKGTITSLLWEQISGGNLTLSGENSNQLIENDKEMKNQLLKNKLLTNETVNQLKQSVNGEKMLNLLKNSRVNNEEEEEENDNEIKNEMKDKQSMYDYYSLKNKIQLAKKKQGLIEQIENTKKQFEQKKQIFLNQSKQRREAFSSSSSSSTSSKN
jgi:hypothetical protein